MVLRAHRLRRRIGIDAIPDRRAVTRAGPVRPTGTSIKGSVSQLPAREWVIENRPRRKWFRARVSRLGTHAIAGGPPGYARRRRGARPSCCRPAGPIENELDVRISHSLLRSWTARCGPTPSDDTCWWCPLPRTLAGGPGAIRVSLALERRARTDPHGIASLRLGFRPGIDLRWASAE